MSQDLEEHFSVLSVSSSGSQFFGEVSFDHGKDGFYLPSPSLLFRRSIFELKEHPTPPISVRRLSSSSGSSVLGRDQRLITFLT